MGEKIIVVGSSTGGTEALKVFLTGLPERAPAVLIAQHMPELFTKSFAERLDNLCAMHVAEAQHHQEIVAGHVYLAPGHYCAFGKWYHGAGKEHFGHLDTYSGIEVPHQILHKLYSKIYDSAKKGKGKIRWAPPRALLRWWHGTLG